MCPACDAAFSSPLAIMPSADQIPTKVAHSEVLGANGVIWSGGVDRLSCNSSFALPKLSALPFSGAVASCCDRLRLFVALAAHHHCPGDPGSLVGQRHCRQLWRASFEQPQEPLATRALHCTANDSHRAGKQHLTQIAIACFGYRSQALLSSGRVLPRDKAQPGGHVSSAAEDRWVWYASHQR